MAGKSAAYYQSLLSNPNVQKALKTIRIAEGATYNTLFGGKSFSSFVWHPLPQRAIKLPNGKTTSAAGAYQFVRGTWDSMAAKLGLKDFSPANQDIAAVALIDGRGALNDVLNGNFGTFIEKTKPEWESFQKRPLSQLYGYWTGSKDSVYQGGGAASSPVGGASYIKAAFELSSEQAKLATQPIPKEWRGLIVLTLALIVFAVVWSNYR